MRHTVNSFGQIKKQDVSADRAIKWMCQAVYGLQEMCKAGVLCPKAMLRGGEDIVGIKESLKLGSNQSF